MLCLAGKANWFDLFAGDRGIAKPRRSACAADAALITASDTGILTVATPVLKQGYALFGGCVEAKFQRLTHLKLVCFHFAKHYHDIVKITTSIELLA